MKTASKATAQALTTSCSASTDRQSKKRRESHPFWSTTISEVLTRRNKMCHSWVLRYVNWTHTLTNPFFHSLADSSNNDNRYHRPSRELRYRAKQSLGVSTLFVCRYWISTLYDLVQFEHNKLMPRETSNVEFYSWILLCTTTRG